MKKTIKFDTLQLGLILGILFPILTIVIAWLVNSEDSFISYLKGFRQMSSLSGLLSLSAIPNLLVFFVFIWTDRIRSARGVIFATLIVAFIMLLFKFL